MASWHWRPGEAARAGPDTELESAWLTGRSGAALSAAGGGWPSGVKTSGRDTSALGKK